MSSFLAIIRSVASLRLYSQGRVDFMEMAMSKLCKKLILVRSCSMYHVLFFFPLPES